MLPDNLPAKRTLLGNGMGDALPVVQHQFMGDLADAVALSNVETFWAGIRIAVFQAGKCSFQLIMRIFGRTASAVRFSILRRRPAPFREGAEHAIASNPADLDARAQAELSFHRSRSVSRCDSGLRHETPTHTSFDLLRRYSRKAQHHNGAAPFQNSAYHRNKMFYEKRLPLGCNHSALA